MHVKKFILPVRLYGCETSICRPAGRTEIQSVW